MATAERYIFRTAAMTFLAGLFVLTAMIWVTQALREIDLMTGKGQTILVFLHLTLMTIPSLMFILAPVALLIAVIFTLNRLNSDSELIVMSAAGMPPGRLLRPFFLLSILVMAFVAIISLWAMPTSFRSIRDLITKIRADVLTRIIREGQFTTLDQGFVFHYRERGPGGALMGIFIQDRRDAERINTYIAESGITVENGAQSFLILEKGSLQRQSKGDRDPAIVQFERYAIDLAQFGSEGIGAPLKPREWLTGELLRMDRSDKYVAANYGRFRAELHDRFTGPLYAIVMALIAFACLGQPRTTRQGRGYAIGLAIVLSAAVRAAGFTVSGLIGRSPSLTPLAYLIPLLAIAGAFIAIFWPHLLRLPRFGKSPASAAPSGAAA
jgi:lipopolysaccharide export system permease protein